MKRFLLQLFAFLALLVLLRVFLVEIYVVRKESMQKTYDPGDRVLITKRFYSLGTNDVVVFRQAGEAAIKRCIGLPGDTVEIRGGRVLVNGKAVPLPAHAITGAGTPAGDVLIRSAIFQSYGASWNGWDFGPYVIPFKGMAVALTEQTVARYGCLFEKEGFSPPVESGVKATYTFRQDYYFVLGDNRPQSEDSRSYGPVAAGDIRGKVIFKF